MQLNGAKLAMLVALIGAVFAAGWLLGNLRTTEAQFPELSDFKCYVLEKGQPPGITVDIVDQFHEEKDVRLGHPSLLCAPAVKRIPGQDPPPVDLNGPHLKCYTIGGQTVNTTVDLFAPQFDQEEIGLRVNAPRYFCVPVLKTVTGGGPPGGGPPATPTPRPTP